MQQSRDGLDIVALLISVSVRQIKFMRPTHPHLLLVVEYAKLNHFIQVHI